MKYIILFCFLLFSSTFINSQNSTVLILPNTQFQVVNFSYQGSDLAQFIHGQRKLIQPDKMRTI